MRTMAEYEAATHDFAYFGERDDWLIAYTTHRDADVIDNANFEALRRMANDGDHAVETFSHWLVGHGSWLLIRPDAPCIPAIQEALEKLEDYPLVDEELYSEMEFNEAVDSAETALRCELGLDEHEAQEAASYVVSWGFDAGGKDDYAYSGVRDYWPSKEAQFFGYLRYRRAIRA